MDGGTTYRRMQRIEGRAHVALGRGGLADLAQAGAAKAMLPRTDAAWPEVVFLNTAGGVTGGDRLDYGLRVGPGARALGATQTAERAYRALGETPGQVSTRLEVGTGARLDWLPQEVIVFEGAHLARRTEVELAPDAKYLGVESIVLGRAAHGEVVARARLDDRRSIRRGGRLVHEEHLALGPDVLADPAALGGARAFATLVFAAQGAEDSLGLVRARLAEIGANHENVPAPVIAPQNTPIDRNCCIAASAWDGRLVVRFAAREAAPLRRALISVIVTLRGVPMPRVWQVDT